MLDQNFQLISKKGLSLFSLPVICSCHYYSGCCCCCPYFSQAEAEQMAKKADAWKEYKEAALVDMMMKVLPQVIIAENSFFYTS